LPKETERGPAHVLSVVSGPASGRSVEFHEQLVIGREGADFDIADPRLSRRHAVLRIEGDSVVVEDLDSLNGTLVNGARIAAPTPIAAKDKLVLGNSELSVERLAEPTSLAPELSEAAVPTRLSATSSPGAQATLVSAGSAPAAADDAKQVSREAGVETPPESAVAASGRGPGRKLILAAALAAALVGSGVAIGWFATPSKKTVKTVTRTVPARNETAPPAGRQAPVTASYVGAGFLSATSTVTGALVPAGAVTRDLGGGTKMGVAITGHPFAVLGQVTIQPGAQTGWHTHPFGMDGFVLVTQGKVSMYSANDPSCRPHVLARGQVAFIGGTLPHDIRNEGTTPVKLYALSFFGHPVQPQNAFLPHARNPACPF
jgi:pSer/pThr/pTyr-binding forkhead associated (FHA) protein/quercetin dioxygenase-like cupin family protein